MAHQRFRARPRWRALPESDPRGPKQNRPFASGPWSDGLSASALPNLPTFNLPTFNLPTFNLPTPTHELPPSPRHVAPRVPYRTSVMRWLRVTPPACIRQMYCPLALASTANLTW